MVVAELGISQDKLAVTKAVVLNLWVKTPPVESHIRYLHCSKVAVTVT